MTIGINKSPCLILMIIIRIEKDVYMVMVHNVTNHRNTKHSPGKPHTVIVDNIIKQNNMNHSTDKLQPLK